MFNRKRVYQKIEISSLDAFNKFAQKFSRWLNLSGVSKEENYQSKGVFFYQSRWHKGYSRRVKKTAVYICFHMVFDVCHMILRNWNFPSRDVTFDDNSERPQSHEWYLLKVIFSIIVKLVMKLEKFTLRLGLNACLLDYVWRYLQVGFHTGFNFFWLTIYFSAVINSSNIIHRGVWFYSYSFWD